MCFINDETPPVDVTQQLDVRDDTLVCRYQGVEFVYLGNPLTVFITVEHLVLL